MAEAISIENSVSYMTVSRFDLCARSAVNTEYSAPYCTAPEAAQEEPSPARTCTLENGTV